MRTLNFNRVPMVSGTDHGCGAMRFKLMNKECAVWMSQKYMVAFLEKSLAMSRLGFASTSAKLVRHVSRSFHELRGGAGLQAGPPMMMAQFVHPTMVFMYSISLGLGLGRDVAKSVRKMICVPSLPGCW